MRTRWGENGYLHSLTYYVNQISASQKMDEVLWGLTNFDNCLDPYDTYEANVEYLRSWLENRILWMDDNVKNLTGGTVTNYATVYNGVDYSLVYDYSYYIAMNPDVYAAFGDDNEAVLAHFVTYGMAEGRIASRNFNVSYYKSTYADLCAAFGDDLTLYYTHYITYGFYEDRKAASG